MPPHVVIVPTQGLCNRLRAMASANILAKFYGTICFTLWYPEESCSCAFEDLFENQLSLINMDEVVNSTYVYNPNKHTNFLFENSSHLHSSEYLIVRGGHEFKHPDMPLEEFLIEKKAFYNSLRFSKEVRELIASHPPVKEGTLAIHYRDYVKQFDEADGRLFSECSPLNDFVRTVRLIRRKHPDRPFLLCSNTSKAHEALAPMGGVVYREAAVRARNSREGILHALVDLVMMSRCDMVIGTTMSSFSDEACFFRMIPKMCMGTEKSSEYHCYGLSSVHGQKFLVPNHELLRELFG